MIKKLWVKFDNLNIACFCEEGNKKCNYQDCDEYVVKFTPVERSEIEKKDITASIYKESKKLNTELDKATKHMNRMTRRLK